MNQQPSSSPMDPHSQIKALQLHLTTIRRNMEEIISENRQLRDTLTQTTQQLTEANARCTQFKRQYLEREEKHGQARQCIDDAITRIAQLQAKIEDVPAEEKAA